MHSQIRAFILEIRALVHENRALIHEIRALVHEIQALVLEIRQLRVLGRFWGFWVRLASGEGGLPLPDPRLNNYFDFNIFTLTWLLGG